MKKYVLAAAVTFVYAIQTGVMIRAVVQLRIVTGLSEVAIAGWGEANKAIVTANTQAMAWRKAAEESRGDFLVCNSMLPKDRRL